MLLSMIQMFNTPLLETLLPPASSGNSPIRITRWSKYKKHLNCAKVADHCRRIRIREMAQLGYSPMVPFSTKNVRSSRSLCGPIPFGHPLLPLLESKLRRVARAPRFHCAIGPKTVSVPRFAAARTRSRALPAAVIRRCRPAQCDPPTGYCGCQDAVSPLIVSVSGAAKLACPDAEVTIALT